MEKNDKTQVLVVEDELVSAAYINKILKDLGYEAAATFPSGEQALSFLETHHVDVVLMDIVLEGELDGIDTARIISERYGTPVIYLTLYSDEQKIDRAVFTEPFGYILKPIQERELHANIRMSLYKSAMEKQIRDNELRFKSIIQYSPLAVITCDEAYGFIYANDNFKKLFGYADIEQLKFADIPSLICPEPQMRGALLTNLMDHGVISGFTTSARTNDGRIIDIRISGSKLLSGEERAEFFIEDITEKLRSAEMARKSEAKFQAIFNSPTQSFFLIDEKCHIHAYNLAAQTLTEDLRGVKLEPGSPFDFLFPGVSEDCRSIIAGKGTLDNFSLEKGIHDKRKSERWFEIVFTIVPANENQTNEYAVSVKEITERKKYESNLKQYILRLEQQQNKLEEQSTLLQNLNDKLSASEANLREINANKDKFFSIIAHDLRSPFNTLIGFSEYLLEDFDLLEKETIKSISGELHKSIKHVFTLLDNLLQWARIQTGRLDYEPEEVSLTDISQSMIKIYGPTAAKKMVHLYFDIPEGVSIRVDKNMFSSALQNLISNAIKFTHRGGWVKVAYDELDGTHRISVTDNGIGMGPELVNKLFKIEENASRNGTELETGTGLGLILSKDFIETNMGKLSVESKPNAGSKFIIELPIGEKRGE